MYHRRLWANIFDTDISGVFGFFWDIYAPTNVCVQDIGSWASMILQNYLNFIEITSNMIHILAFGGGLKCPRKIHLNTQCVCVCGGGVSNALNQ